MTDPRAAALEKVNQLIAALPPSATRDILSGMVKAANSPDLVKAINTMVPVLAGTIIDLERRIAKLEGSTQTLDQRLNENADLAAVLREIDLPEHRRLALAVLPAWRRVTPRGRRRQVGLELALAPPPFHANAGDAAAAARAVLAPVVP
jgi:hypothetical protein